MIDRKESQKLAMLFLKLSVLVPSYKTCFLVNVLHNMHESVSFLNIVRKDASSCETTRK